MPAYEVPGAHAPLELDHVAIEECPESYLTPKDKTEAAGLNRLLDLAELTQAPVFPSLLDAPARVARLLSIVKGEQQRVENAITEEIKKTPPPR